MLAEYAAKLPNEYAGEAYYKEHYELMIGEGFAETKICKINAPDIRGAFVYLK